MKKFVFSTLFFLFAIGQVSIAGECREFIELLSATEIAAEWETTEWGAIAKIKINLWENPSDTDRGKVVGKLIPGSRAMIIEKHGDYYKVKSPLDKSVGWINKIQIKKIVIQDDKTYKPCK